MPTESAAAAPAYDFDAYLNSLPPRVPVPEACKIRQVSRTRLYQLAGQGRIRFVKDGASTFVDTATIIADLMKLPTADIQPPTDTRRAASQVQSPK